MIRTMKRSEHFCRAMLCKRGLCRHAVSVCLSVCIVRAFCGVGRNRDSAPIPGFIACCERCDRHVLSTRCRRTVASCDTYRWGSKRRSLLMAGDDDEMFMTRSLNGTPNHLRSDKFVAYVTSNKRLLDVLYHWTYTTDGHEASRGLSATAQLLVSVQLWRNVMTKMNCDQICVICTSAGL